MRRARTFTLSQSNTPRTARLFAHSRGTDAVEAKKVEPNTPTAPMRNRISAHGPRVSVYIRDSVVMTSFPVGSRPWGDRKSTRLNSSHVAISYAVFCLTEET